MCTSSGRGIEIRMNMKEKLYVVPEDINNASVDELNFWLSRFVVECRRDDGKPYPPNSLLQHYGWHTKVFKTKKPQISFFDKTMLHLMICEKLWTPK